MEADRKIRTLHLIALMNDGGAQKIVLNYLDFFCKDKDIEIKLIVYGNKTDSNCNKIIENSNYNVTYLFNDKNKFIRKIKQILFGKKRLEQAIKKYNPDIVHVHISPFLTIALKPILNAKIPIKFDTLHSNPLRFVGKDLKNIRLAFQKYNFIPICVTKEQEEIAREYYGFTKSEVVYNGVDFDKIQQQIIPKQEARTIFNFSPSDFVVIGVGRLDPVKNYDFLIKSFKLILSKNCNAKLALAGEGAELENLKKISNSLEISDKVVFLGNISNPVHLYCAADVLAVTSSSESSSLVLLEAQKCGLRCVISNGVPEESILTMNVRKMNYEASLEEWAEALLDVHYIGKKNNDFVDYEINTNSQKMKEIYLKYWKEYMVLYDKK